MRSLVELHSHLEGTISAGTLLEMAKGGREHLLPTTDPVKLAGALAVPGLGGFDAYFKYTRPFRTRLEDIQFFTRAELAKAHSLGIAYAEYRFNPMGPAKRGVDPWRILEVINEEMTIAESRTDTKFALIFGMARDTTTQIESYLDIAADAWKEKLICGVDLNGYESGFPTRDFIPLFSRFHRTGCPIVIHAGEWDGPESVWAALRCGAARIGHGTRSIEDEDLVDALAKERITLEVCPTSNVYTEVFESVDDVPVRRLFDRGVAVTINSDDPAAFGSDISREFLIAKKIFGFSPGEMDTLVRNAIDGSFLREEEKSRLAARVFG